MFRYYSTIRPLGPGTFPQKDGREIIVNFDGPTFCDSINQEAWGYIEYPEPLTEQEIKDYELVIGGMKTYYCVTTSVDDKGNVRAAITSIISAVRKPEDSFRSLKMKDIYHYWFDDPEEAKKFVEEAKMA